MYCIEFVIKGLPMLANRRRRHWTILQNEKNKWFKHIYAVIVSRKLKPSSPLVKAKLTFTRFSSSEPDFDGLVSSFKNVQDALVKGGIIVDDNMSVIGQPTYLWEKTSPGEGRIKIKVEGIE